jgi:hypothetical protein
MSFEVICITKPDVNSSHEQITHIGYYESMNQPRVIIPVEDAIKRIELYDRAFHVYAGPKIALLKVERQQDGKAYIKTVPDELQKDNLLNLPRC